jgi:PRC-barrel domain
MTTAEQLEQWRGRAVVDADDQDIGKLDDVYYAPTGEPVLVRIRSGLLGRRQAVVPLDGSSVTRDHLRVGYRSDQIETARHDEIGEYLDARTAASIGTAYGVALPAAEAGYETSAQLDARRAAAIAAKQQADSLEDDAHRLGGEADHARAKAAHADASATQAERDAAAASEQADAARREAEAAARAALPPRD